MQSIIAYYEIERICKFISKEDIGLVMQDSMPKGETQ